MMPQPENGTGAAVTTLVAMVDVRAAVRAWRRYRGAGLGVRTFLLGRLAVAPLGAMGPDLLRLHGRVLSVGSGFGIIDQYVAEVNPGVTVEGVDVDARRVAVARAAATARVTARVGDVTRMPAGGGFDGALAVDVFHHVPAAEHASLVASLHANLAGGGLCLVKEMARTPRRQYLWNRLHDRIVSGPGPIWCREPDDMAGLLRGAGFVVEDVRRLGRLGLYPQYLVVAHKPEAGPPCRAR
jgi:2-polyprenyl-3-methyl-5-hydroxy-6-metoxy-1,4-benzoquinol methylase